MRRLRSSRRATHRYADSLTSSGSYLTSSADSEALAAEWARESATNRSGVLELGLGKCQTKIPKFVIFGQNPPHPGSQRWPAAALPTPALRPTIIDMCRYESQNTRNGRESTQDHLFMSQHAWNCLELTGIAQGCLEFIFLSDVRKPPRDS